MARKRKARTAAKTKLTAWSFSRYSTYEICPSKLSFAVHDRLKEPQNEAMARGSRIHELGEHYVTGKIGRVPKELSYFVDDFRDLRKRKDVAVEDEWAFDKQWGETSWFDNKTHVRIKVDAHHPLDKKQEHKDAWAVYLDLLPPGDLAKQETLLDGSTHRIIDYKTGKVNVAKGMEQCSLYALGGFMRFPECQAIITELWWLDQDHVTEAIFFRKDLKVLLKEWQQRTKKMLNDTRFDPTPGRLCGWCHYSTTKGGPCVAG